METRAPDTDPAPDAPSLTALGEEKLGSGEFVSRGPGEEIVVHGGPLSQAERVSAGGCLTSDRTRGRVAPLLLPRLSRRAERRYLAWVVLWMHQAPWRHSWTRIV
jgi:hypothetical protein